MFCLFLTAFLANSGLLKTNLSFYQAPIHFSVLSFNEANWLIPIELLAGNRNGSSDTLE
jgi:hypothetical protein